LNIPAKFNLNSCDDCGIDGKLFENLCEKNCFRDYLSTNLDINTKIYDKQKLLILMISHSNIPEPYYIHIPLITFIEYISCIGGLISLWFGLSLWTSVYFSIDLVFKKFKKKFENNFILNHIISIYLSNN
jgi:hypothetical protein